MHLMYNKAGEVLNVQTDSSRAWNAKMFHSDLLKPNGFWTNLMPLLKRMCKVEMGFCIAATEPEVSGKGM